MPREMCCWGGGGGGEGGEGEKKKKVKPWYPSATLVDFVHIGRRVLILPGVLRGGGEGPSLLPLFSYQNIWVIPGKPGDKRGGKEREKGGGGRQIVILL